MSNKSTQNSSVTCLYFLQAHSPIHVGVGEGTSYINLPTAREITTQYPYVPGSSIKGVLREEAELRNPASNSGRYGSDPVVLAFGPPSDRAGDARGGLVISDARLLFLPMRSLIGGFAMVTCPLILRRLARDADLAGFESEALEKVVETLNDGDCRIPGDSVLCYEQELVLLEDVRFKAEKTEKLDGVAEWLKGKCWSEKDSSFYQSRMAVVSDTVFGFFVRLNLEVRSRVKIDEDTGTAAASGPWLEEYMPAESILFGLAQGRKTALVMIAPDKKSRPLNNRSNEVEDSLQVTGAELEQKAAKDSLDELTRLVGDSPLLRFGGKSSGGAGRAFFRLAHGQGG